MPYFPVLMIGNRFRGALVFAAWVLVSTACGNNGDEVAQPLPPPAYEAPGSNVDLWLETMEIGSRELFAAREAVIASVGVEQTSRIADIGAGTGLYALLFAQAAPEGVTFAVDIEPRFLKEINRKAGDLDITNITAVLGRGNSISLPPSSIDIAFISDTYNYFTQPVEIMETVRGALSDGGALYILDFDLKSGEPRSGDTQHVRVGKQALIDEVEGTGFTFVEEVSVDGLSETFMLHFKPAD